MICLKDVSRTRQLLNVQVQMRISTFHNIASRLQHHDFCPRSWQKYSTCCFPSGEPRCRPGAVRIMFCRKEVLRTCQLRQPGCTGSSVLLLASAAPPAAGSSLLLTVALTCKPNESTGLLARGVRQKGLSWVYMPPDMQTPMPGSRSFVLGFNATQYADANARVKKLCPGSQCHPICRRQCQGQETLSWVSMPPDMQTPMPGSRHSNRELLLYISARMLPYTAQLGVAMRRASSPRTLLSAAGQSAACLGRTRTAQSQQLSE